MRTFTLKFIHFLIKIQKKIKKLINKQSKKIRTVGFCFCDIVLVVRFVKLPNREKQIQKLVENLIKTFQNFELSKKKKNVGKFSNSHFTCCHKAD